MNLSVHRQKAAACVSLSKSTMSKTRTASVTRERPIRLTPDVGGGGYLANLEFRVKSFFSKLSDITANRPGGLRQKPAASKETTETSQAISRRKLRSHPSRNT